MMPTSRFRSRGAVARREAGLSLIELMIAMAIGLIMILALSRIYLASAEGAQEAEARATLIDKVRFLHERFNYEFRRADFWGRVPADAERLGILSVSGDCDGEFAFGRTADTPADRPLGIWASRESPAGCSLHDPLAEQTFVAVRYAAEPCRPGQCDFPSVSSFYPYIGFFIGSAPSLPERGGDDDLWRYDGSLYYLSSDETALRRLWISGSRLVNQEVLRGVEALAYRWYVESGGVGTWLATDELTPPDARRVTAVEIEVVVSARTRATYQEPRDYTLGNGVSVQSEPGKMYRQFSFVVPLEMHRVGGGDE